MCGEKERFGGKLCNGVWVHLTSHWLTAVLARIRDTPRILLDHMIGVHKDLCGVQDEGLELASFHQPELVGKPSGAEGKPLPSLFPHGRRPPLAPRLSFLCRQYHVM